MGIALQVVGSLLISCLCMCLGIIFTWPSPTLILFSSANTTLDRPMTEGELALFGSLSSVGALVGTPLIGVLLDKLGRKKCAILFSLFGVISWTMISVCNKVEVILASMFVCGLYGAAYLIVPVYITEICQDSIRGAMTSCTMIFMCIGMLWTYMLGGFVEYHVMNYASLTVSVVTTVSLLFLKESPTFLMVKGLEKEAAEAMAFYRGTTAATKVVESELRMIKRSLSCDSEDTSPEEEKLNPLVKQPVTGTFEKFSFWKFMKQSRSSRRAFFVTMFLLTASILQGPTIIQVYAEPLFQKAMPNVPLVWSTSALAIIGIIGGILSGYLMEKLGRRSLMIYTSIAIAVLCVVLGLQIHLSWGPSWLVLLNIYLFMTLYILGIGTIPYVIMAEVFLPQIKSYMTMIAIEWVWFCNSIVLFIFTPLMKALGLGPMFYIFAGVAVIATVFTWLYQPETRGVTVEEIQLKFLENRLK